MEHQASLRWQSCYGTRYSKIYIIILIDCRLLEQTVNCFQSGVGVGMLEEQIDFDFEHSVDLGVPGTMSRNSAREHLI